jgi:hypothetical protein
MVPLEDTGRPGLHPLLPANLNERSLLLVQAGRSD